MVYIAVLGHGVVGSGVLEVFYKNNKSILSKAGIDMDIKYILDLREFPSLPYADKFVKTFDPIINDPEVKIVVEVMGGLDPSYDYVRRCLLAGKSVVTSNKALVAAYGAELLDIAKKNNVNFLFEASVGGGIPILRPISQCLAANEIKEIVGILNGTTNFILTKIIERRRRYLTEVFIFTPLWLKIFNAGYEIYVTIVISFPICGDRGGRNGAKLRYCW